MTSIKAKELLKMIQEPGSARIGDLQRRSMKQKGQGYAKQRKEEEIERKIV